MKHNNLKVLFRGMITVVILGIAVASLFSCSSSLSRGPSITSNNIFAPE